MINNLQNYKITVFGDSVSKGVFLDNNRLRKTEITAVDLLKNQYGIGIDNRSNFGQTLARLCNKGEVQRYVQSITDDQPNLAVFCIGGNDADYDWKSVALSPNGNHSANTDLDAFENMLQDNITMLQNKGVTVALTTLLPVDSQRYFDNVICALADGKQVMRFLNGDLSNISRHQQCYNDCILRVAMRNNCKIIDLRREFCLKNNYLDYMCEDGIHPNAQGQTLMAQAVARYIDSYSFADIA